MGAVNPISSSLLGAIAGTPQYTPNPNQQDLLQAQAGAERAQAQQTQMNVALLGQHLNDMGLYRAGIQAHNGDADAALSDPKYGGQMNQDTVMGILKDRAVIKKNLSDAAEAASKAKMASQDLYKAHESNFSDMAQSWLDQSAASGQPTNMARVDAGMHAFEGDDPNLLAGLQSARNAIQTPDDLTRFLQHAAQTGGGAQRAAALKNQEAATGKVVSETKAADEKTALGTLSGLPGPDAYPAWFKANQNTMAARMIGPDYDAGRITQALRGAVPVSEQPTFQMTQQKADLMKKFMDNPQSGMDQIDNTLGKLDAGSAAGYKNALSAALSTGDLALASHVMENVAQKTSDLSTKMNPKIQAAEAGQQAANAYATIAPHVQEETAKQIQIAKNSPDAFAGIMDPKQRAQAQAQYEKDSKDYVSKVADAQRLSDYISAAQSGNKAAPGLIGIAELRTIVNRVNRQELEKVSSGAGSWVDQAQGFLNGAKEGQPIPPAVMQGMSGIAGIMKGSADNAYRANLAVTNGTYGSKAQPIDTSAFIKPAASAAKTYTPADIQRAVAANPGMTAAQIDQAFKAKGWKLQ